MYVTNKVLKAATLSIALLGGTAVVTTIALPDMAFAGNGNGNGGGNGNGNGGGNGNGNSADSGNGNGNGKSASSNGGGSAKKAQKSQGGILKSLFQGKDDRSEVNKTKKTKTKRTQTAKIQKKIAVATVAPKPRGNKLARALGVHPSELGALNAANASPQALANASPNSRVGKLAIYADEVGAIQDIQLDLDAAADILASLDTPERSVDEIDVATGNAATEKADLESQLDGLQADLNAAGGTDAAIEEQIASVTDAISAKDDELNALAEERSDAEEYAAAEEDVAQLESDLAEQEDVARTALEAAANKEVNDDIEAAVRAMLGLETEPSEPTDELDEVSLSE